ncbi:acetylcholine-gated cation-selective channel [Branchiostoma belcheri]|nr:acetylcholine-gated cation-selective channel [Branchiostoma belcheri]
MTQVRRRVQAARVRNAFLNVTNCPISKEINPEGRPIRHGVSLTRGSEGANVTYAYKLMQNLLQNYSVAVRPSMNLSNPIQVKFGIALSQIIDMDERNQILTAYVWLRMRWNDCSLKWNPAEYDGLAELRIPSTHVWKPDIVLYNKVPVTAPVTITMVTVLSGSLTFSFGEEEEETEQKRRFLTIHNNLPRL